MSDETATAELSPLGFSEFLSSVPPGSARTIADVPRPAGRVGAWYVDVPEIVLPCPAETCDRPMLYEPVEEKRITLALRSPDRTWLQFRCKHCEVSAKEFAVVLTLENADRIIAVKLGELPPFGPRIAPRVLRLIQEDAEYFKLGRRAESLGLGIGAFSYYRRVVERQRDRLFEKIIAVAERIGVQPEQTDTLRKARANFQFDKAMADFKDALPDALLIDGHNPMRILHRALSRGLHNDSDGECLELARDIRCVLTELADRISRIMQEKVDLTAAVARLMND